MTSQQNVQDGAEQAVMLPASYVQELLWLMDRASPGSSAYNVPRTRKLVGPLSVDALRRAFDALVARHEILRTTYAFHEDHPVQVIHPARPVEFTVVDLRGQHPDHIKREVDRIVSESARRPFDLTRDMLMRVIVIQTSDTESVLHFDSHHIAFDGWSRDVLFRELAAFYGEFSGGPAADLPELPIQYADYAMWERQYLQGERLEQLLQYWRAQLGDADFVLDLPTDFVRPAVPGVAGVTERITFPASTTAAIKELGQRNDATLYMTLLAAYTTVLHRYSGQANVLVGSPIAGRSRPETEGLIGYFANTIVQRARFASDPTFSELLGQIRESALGAYDHQEVPFEKLVLELQGGQQLSHAPLFQVVFTMLGGGAGQSTGGRFGDVEVHSFGTDDTITKFDLTLFMAEHNGELTLTLRGRADLFTAATVARTLSHVRTVLESAVAEPTIPVSRISLLSADEKREQAQWNETAVDFGPRVSVPQLFAAQAARVPDRIAVVSGGAHLTYAELDTRANQLARKLQELGVSSGAPVGLSLDRSTDLIVGLLGILKAGAAYAPLLPELPAARLSQQLSESGARVVVTSAAHVAPFAGVTTVALDRDRDALKALSAAPIETFPSPDSPAYVLYTSGSTGVPKGVVVTHANIIHYTNAVARVLSGETGPDPLRALDGWRFGMVNTLGADLGNTSLFPALCAGGTLYVVQPDASNDPVRFTEHMAAHPLDVLKITPSHLAALTSNVGGADLARALPSRWIVLGGEPLHWDVAERLLAANGPRVLNHYGPTETTVGVSTFEVTQESTRQVRTVGAQTVPIGTPLANVKLHVLDAARQAQPVGVPGELYATGLGVADGYLNRPELTAERFVDLAGEGRAYRTGDRVRRLPSGAIEFLGRFDDQVKIRGFRVELGEIAQVIGQHPAVAQCVVVVRGSGADAAVVAYVVAKGAGSDATPQYALAHAGRLTTDGVVEWAAARLPEYEVPASVVMLDQIPLTPNGKVDRAALPDPEQQETTEDAFIAPRTPSEEAIAAIWCDVLKKERVGVTENFIALGGHSLLAIRVLGKLSRQFGIRLPLRTLFDAPTVEQLAELIDIEMKLAALESMTDAESAATADRDR